MIELTIRLEDYQHVKVKRKSEKQKISQAQYIRNLIDND